MVRAHAAFYARGWRFGPFFEAKAARESGESEAESWGTRVSEQRFTLDLTAAGGPRRYYR